MAYNALHKENIPNAIVNSYSHIGIHPFNSGRANTLIQNLSPQVDDSILVAGSELLALHSKAMVDAIREAQTSNNEPRLRSKRAASLTTQTRLLTRLDVINLVEMKNRETELKGMKASQLQSYLRDVLNIPLEELTTGTFKSSNRPKYKPLPQLLAIAKEHLERQQQISLQHRLDTITKLLEDPPLGLLIDPSVIPIREEPDAELPTRERPLPRDSLESTQPMTECQFAIDHVDSEQNSLEVEDFLCSITEEEWERIFAQ